jgi:hypothetical protein
MKLKLLDGSSYPSIPSLCLCNCGEIVYEGRKFIFGHQNRGIYHPKYGVRGTHLLESTKEKIKVSTSGEKNHFFNKHHSQEQKDKWSIDRTGVIPKESTRKLYSERMKINNPMFNPEIARKLGELISGENHPNWQGGKSFEEYPKEFNRYLKEYILIRDNNTCKLCSKSQEEQILKLKRTHTVHHIDYDKKNCHPLNLITLCSNCHCKTNYYRKYYEQYFTLFMKDNINKLK